mmetsp:Transcript_59780/g.96822  ORF Transcript_59780/g.96822 Transcript_59780/m.96822 type:complete len:235 (-) Transcript_59780:71-775(-)
MAAPCACLTTRTPVKSLPGPLLSSHPILTALRVNETTMPKLPPPPRIAQNRSIWSPSGLASTMEPLASTRVAERRESIVSPIHRAIKPTPPPIVAPMHPTDGALPSVTARPCEAHAASTSQFRAPPPIFTVGGVAEASTSTELSLIMSRISAFDMETVECPPHLIATETLCLFANFRMPATSADELGRTMPAGKNSWCLPCNAHSRASPLIYASSPKKKISTDGKEARKVSRTS